MEDETAVDAHREFVELKANVFLFWLTTVMNIKKQKKI